MRVAGGGIEILGVAALLLGVRRLFPRFTSGRGYEVLVPSLSALLLWYWDPRALVLTSALAGVATGAIAWLRRGARDQKGALALAVTLLAAPLVLFKYVPWVAAPWLERDGGLPSLVVPLGLSFTTFRLIGIVLDARALRIDVAPGRVLSMALFFPTLPAGPITGLQNVGRIDGSETPAASAVAGGRRILSGLLRKIVLADLLHASVVGPWMAAGVAALTPSQALILPVLLGMYLYWDFAGYSDIAIGSARLAGFKVPENFNRPYASASLVEFWRRWHITLSEWIRLRLMMKMVGRRSPPWHFHVATVVSMAICGLWHGAGVNFLAWGVWHGVGLVAVHLFGSLQRSWPRLSAVTQGPAWQPAAVALTFTFVTAGWVLFFFPLDDAGLLVSRAASFRPGFDAGPLTVAAVVAALLLAYGSATRLTAAWLRIPAFPRGVLVSICLGVVAYLLAFSGGGAQEFVYTQF
jgi:alginate O-acetyltransferase complex protein AlgI